MVHDKTLSGHRINLHYLEEVKRTQALSPFTQDSAVDRRNFRSYAT